MVFAVSKNTPYYYLIFLISKETFMNLQTKRYQEKQPAEWEEFLKDVTIEPDYREIPYDPIIVNDLKTGVPLNELIGLSTDQQSDQERLRQIELVRVIALRKLRGITRECILLLLSTGASHKQLARKLDVSIDTIQRSVKRAIKQITRFLSENNNQTFPTPPGKRPSLRVSFFPLDTNKERERFQLFVNENPVNHIAYRSDNLFKEALVIYLTGKPARKARFDGMTS